MCLLSQLRTFFDETAPIRAGDRILIAYSGGSDSTALLLGLKHLVPELGIRLHALHVDHQLDGDSGRRAHAAANLCRELQIPLVVVGRSVPEGCRPGESVEVAARRIRYEALETERRNLGAVSVATAHHADDQIETLLIRILYGTGIEGLAGIQARRGNIIRPLLTCRKRQLEDFVAGAKLDPVVDPSNLHLGTVRNRLRHLLWPQLRARNPGLDLLIARLSMTATSARKSIETRLRRELDLQITDRGPTFDRLALAELPSDLWPFALSLVHRQAELPYPPPAAAQQELERQIRGTGRIGCDCGGGWRWESQERRLGLYRKQPPMPGFAYTVQAPGECEIPELSLRFRIRRGVVDDWMFRRSNRRAGLDLPLEPGGFVTVRSRQVGDRIRPFGCLYTRRLKDVLIDRRVPRYERSRLPLLEVDSRLAWIPGVTIDDSFKVETGKRVWIAELESL